MATVPHLVSVSEFRANQKAALRGLSEDPVYLTHRGRVIAVLVDPDKWARLLDLVEDLEDALVTTKALQEVEQDPNQLVSLEELEAELDEPVALSE